MAVALGYELQNLNSPQSKTYLVLGLNGKVITNWGGQQATAAGKGTFRRDKDFPTIGSLTASAMAGEVAARAGELHTEKFAKGYTTTLIAPTVLDLTDTEAATDETAVAAFRTRAAAGEGIAQTSIFNAGTSYRQADNAGAVNVPNVPTAAPAPAATPVAKRAPRPAVTQRSVTLANGGTYRVRDLGGHSDVEALRKLRAGGIPVRLLGSPGAGKTALARAAFEADLVRFNGHSDVTVASLVGTWQPDTASDGYTFSEGPLTRCMREGKVLLYDEIARSPQGVNDVLFSVLDSGTLRLDDRPDLPEVHAAPGFYVICTYNDNTIGSRELDEALISRFSVGITVTTDIAAARDLNVPAKALTLAENLAVKDAEDRRNGGIGVWKPEMRELLEFRKLVDLGLGEPFAANVLVGACTRPGDLPTVCETASRIFGTTVAPLRLGAQI